MYFNSSSFLWPLNVLNNYMQDYIPTQQYTTYIHDYIKHNN